MWGGTQINFLLGVFVVFRWLGKADELVARSNLVPEGGLHLFFGKHVPIFNNSINHQNLTHFSVPLTFHTEVPTWRLAIGRNGSRDRNFYLGGNKVWVFRESIGGIHRFKHDHSGTNFSYPAGCLSLVNATTLNEGGRGVSLWPVSNYFRAVHKKWLAFPNINHNPSSFAGDLRVKASADNFGLIPHAPSLLRYDFESVDGSQDAAESDQNKIDIRKVCRSNQATEITFRICGSLIFLFWTFLLLGDSVSVQRDRRRRISRGLGAVCFVTGSAAFLCPPYYECENKNQQNEDATNPPFVWPAFFFTEIMYHDIFSLKSRIRMC